MPQSKPVEFHYAARSDVGLVRQNNQDSGYAGANLLVLEDEYASSQHARLTPADGRWWIEDLGSRNGTFVDDERLTSPRELNVGDIVRIGQTTLELVK